MLAGMTESNHHYGIYWFGVALVLGALTFGFFGLLYFILYLACFAAGLVAILYDHSYNEVGGQSHYFANTLVPEALPLYSGIDKITAIDYAQRELKADQRLTGSSNIDEKIHECVEYLLRDYVKYWYNDLSDDPELLHYFRVSLHDVIRAFAMRCKVIDWQPYLTTNLVDDFASHVKLFRKAQDKMQKLQVSSNAFKQRIQAMQANDQGDDRADTASVNSIPTSMNKNFSNANDNASQEEIPKIEDLFFDNEVSLEKICRELVSCDVKKQCEYLQDVCEVLLYLLLPEDDFHCRPLKYLLREIMVQGIFLPMFKLYSDPDYLNLYVNWLVSDNCVSSEWFLSVLRRSSILGELHAVREKAEEEINKIRSKDTVGDDITVKQQLSSMRYVKTFCERKIHQQHEGNVYVDGGDLYLEGLQPEQRNKLYNLPLSVILRNNVALQIFIEYMQSVNGQAYLFFWLTVDGYRASAEQQLNEVKIQQLQGTVQGRPDMEMLRMIGRNIYDQYLSKHAQPRVPLDQTIDRQLQKKLESSEPSPYLFDDIQQKVFIIMQKDENFYPAFKQSTLYMKLLAELDLLREPSFTSADTNGSASGSSMDELAINENEEPIKLTALITQTGICREHGKTYALYAITVTRHWSGGKNESWDTFRRYREFHDLHVSLKENGSNLGNLGLPGKTFFKDLKEDFLEKRRAELNQYLSTILSLRHPPKSMECLHLFLDAKAYQKTSKTFASKVDTMMRTSVKSVTNFVTQAPDNLIDGIQRASDKVSDGFMKFSDRLPGSGSERKTSAEELREQMDYNIDNNIPLGILLLLMDEVFDLKKRNQWLRRQIVAALQQVIRAIFGDRMNKKIVDYVDSALSADQVAEYVKKFRDAFWPNGILAEATAERDEATIMRTRVLTKTKLHGVIPDELRPLIGSETSRRGVMLIFEMVQHEQLNRRFCYVLLEGVLNKIFPHNRFGELFTKFHSASPKMRAYKREMMSRGPEKRSTNHSTRSLRHER
uniref:Sorting nexin-13 n=1 Tax=Phallusia mammillata TaxID=59560 RepID=A0A6F9DSN6_9ASCI|nr:sorting nexin-13 [Phallusia mammillata]